MDVDIGSTGDVNSLVGASECGDSTCQDWPQALEGPLTNLPLLGPNMESEGIVA